MLIEQIQVKGYKSLVDATLHVRPLTLLAGTNSSGKSSIMQPLLLIKQTMEAPYQPAGALVLGGENTHVDITNAEQILSKVSGASGNTFSINFIGSYRNPGNQYAAHHMYLEMGYEATGDNFINTYQSSMTNYGMPVTLRPNMSWEEIMLALPQDITILPRRFTW